MNAEELLARHEGKTLEFKRDLSSPNPILKTLAAFSNTSGGVIVIGVADKTRSVDVVADPLDIEERIMKLATDGIRPQILPEVEVLAYRGSSLVAITVFPGPLRPYFVNRLGREQGAFIRVGSTNRKASIQILAELERTARNISFDEQPFPTLSLSDLDLKTARLRFSKHRRLTSRDLGVLGLTIRQGRKEVPSNGGVILFGLDRLSHFPDAYIRMALFEGKDRATILDRMDALSDPIQAIDDALDFVEKHSTIGMQIEGARRRDIPQYPPVAIREAVVNAVVHADYSQTGSPIRIALFVDRVEIENPGLLPFGLTVEDIRDGVSKLRNRVIGRVFHEVGLIEQWGSGIQRMLRACSEMGLPMPSFEEIGTHFRVTLYGNPIEEPNQVEGTARLILDLLNDDKSRSTSTIAETLDLSTRTIRTHLKRLVENGLVVEIGKGPTDPQRVYRLRRK